MNRPAASLLKLAGALSSAVASLHFGIIFAGAPAYRYFGAGERMARLDEGGSLWPGFITLGLTLLFSAWAAYAFSAAGLVRPLPGVKAGLVIIGSIYTLRGLVLFPQLVWFFSGFAAAVPLRQLLFSSVSLTIGLTYLIGVQGAWRDL